MSAAILGIIGTAVGLLAFVLRWYLTRKSNQSGLDRATIESINAAIKRSQNIKTLVGNLSKPELDGMLKEYFRK